MYEEGRNEEAMQVMADKVFQKNGLETASSDDIRMTVIINERKFKVPRQDVVFQGTAQRPHFHCPITP